MSLTIQPALAANRPLGQTNVSFKASPYPSVRKSAQEMFFRNTLIRNIAAGVSALGIGTFGAEFFNQIPKLGDSVNVMMGLGLFFTLAITLVANYFRNRAKMHL